MFRTHKTHACLACRDLRSIRSCLAQNPIRASSVGPRRSVGVGRAGGRVDALTHPGPEFMIVCIRRLLAARRYSGRVVDQFAQDVRVPGMTCGLCKHVDQNIVQRY